MSSHGRTIILSIHQPRYSIYRLFDSLTLLVSGKQVYHGPAQRALDYFSDIGYTCEPHNNPADFFLDVINGDSTAIAFDRIKAADDSDPDRVTSSRQNIEDHLVQEYRGSQFYGETKAQLERITMNREYSVKTPSRTITYNTSFSTQFRWVLKRTFTNLILNPQTSFAQVCVCVLLCVYVCGLYLQWCLFFTCCPFLVATDHTSCCCDGTLWYFTR
ncbi:broad substrate specificity ATP-binding cassette transporter ABCG2-like [Salvelinus fontinalis]|uniref:broad substrate specificity ATP-binding cassette transporter ABCG2-like n=1 Tax=Salvelinus fontinalis TaxID=8038 RepID=UPI002485ED99|nr:broad substrate specificity ATP-binding cassette transporter ABCG2-like [Salvelinus fontinalis]